jgi:hypothetical protein
MEAIISVALQTKKISKLIISDDTKNNQVIEFLEQRNIKKMFPQLDLSLIEGPKKGTWENVKNLLNLIDEYDAFHIMTDDDLIYPDFMRKHCLIHQQARPLVTVSKRWMLHENGMPIGVAPMPDNIYNNSNLYFYINNENLISNSILNINNFLGELPQSLMSVKFKSSFINRRINNIKFSGLEDIGSFLIASELDGLIFINETLGGFRRHSNQHTINYKTKNNFCSTIAWIALSIAVEEQGKIGVEQLTKNINIIFKILDERNSTPEDVDLSDLKYELKNNIKIFKEKFNKFWEGYAW